VSLRRWLGLSGHDDPEPAVAGLDEIGRALTDLEPRRARFVACFAYILGRVARADHRVTAEESAEMERIVARHGDLPPAQAAIVVAIATAQGVRHGGTEDFLVTREFTRLATRDERLALLDCLFALSSADRSIVTLEDNEIRRIASELKLEHGDFIAARAAYLQHLKVLDRPPDP
jgi:uncharacterized tellurite resistance protein B-like protein